MDRFSNIGDQVGKLTICALISERGPLVNLIGFSSAILILAINKVRIFRLLIRESAGSMQAESSRQKKELFLIYTFSFALSAKIATGITPDS